MWMTGNQMMCKQNGLRSFGWSFLRKYFFCSSVARRCFLEVDDKIAGADDKGKIVLVK